jgi:RNA polymerase sigma factor (TIGR02999 family)
MDAEVSGDLTAILSEVRAGRPDAQDRLVRAIHDELLRTARRLMRRERRGHTLQAEDLVQEALARLLGGGALMGSADRRQLFASTTQAMRQVLVDHARRRNAGKREGRRARVPLDLVLAGFDAQGLDVLDLHQALERMAQLYPRQARVVELRFFGRLSIAEVVETLGVSDANVESDWRFARAWLRGQLGGLQR